VLYPLDQFVLVHSVQLGTERQPDPVQESVAFSLEVLALVSGGRLCLGCAARCRTGTSAKTRFSGTCPALRRCGGRGGESGQVVGEVGPWQGDFDVGVAAVSGGDGVGDVLEDGAGEG
jgi:hypothetical protein